VQPAAQASAQSPGDFGNAAIDWYRRGLLSQGGAAEIAGVSRADFIDALAARRIEVVQLEGDELRRELGDG